MYIPNDLFAIPTQTLEQLNGLYEKLTKELSQSIFDEKPPEIVSCDGSCMGSCYWSCAGSCANTG